MVKNGLSPDRTATIITAVKVWKGADSKKFRTSFWASCSGDCPPLILALFEARRRSFTSDWHIALESHCK